MKASQIKFKAWDEEEEKFIRNVQIDRIPTQNTRFGFKLKTRFDLFQYTGEKDTAGKEIYCGDILEVSLHPHLDRYEVIFENGAFGIDEGEDFGFRPLGVFLGYYNGMNGTVTVVGHIKTHEI